MNNNKSAIIYFHASADLYGSDYVLLELAKKASETFHVLVYLPMNGPLVNALEKLDIEVKVLDMAVLRRECLSFIGMFDFIRKLILSTGHVYLTQKKYDVVAFHTNTSAVWTGFFSAWILRKKHFWQVMEIIEKPKIVSRIIAYIVGIFSNEVFCISDAVRDHFLLNNKSRASKFKTIYHGVDRKIYNMQNIDEDKVRQKLGIDSNTILVGFAGRFNAWKGQEVFAAAARKILSNLEPNTKVHFLFLGSVFAEQHKYEIELKQLLELSPELKEHSTMLGFQNDFQNWLGAMDILVLPSKLPEPNATVTVAAMTLGIPVVGTNIGGTVESVVDNCTGFLVNPNDFEQLALKIHELINSSSLRKEFGTNAIIRANNMFSIESYTEKVLETYNHYF